jgi:hypothetical protein
MNGKFQMQGGKNWFCRNRSMPTGSSATLIGWHLCTSMGPNGGSVAMDSGIIKANFAVQYTKTAL